MSPPSTDRVTLGIVDPVAGFERFSLSRHEPRPELAWAVDWYWIVRWDLEPGDTHEQRIIPYPTTHLVFEDLARVHGISRDEFVRQIEGQGRAVGARFRPAGFRPFLGRAMTNVVGRRYEASPVFGPRAAAIAADLLARPATEETAALASVVDDFLISTGVEPLPMTATVNDLVDQIAADPSLTRVDDLAARLQVSTRRLQRLFADHVGIGPKWVINRLRIHEAAERAVDQPDVDWSRVAAELGYSDQAHLVREFTAAVGTSPGRYVDTIKVRADERSLGPR